MDPGYVDGDFSVLPPSTRAAELEVLSREVEVESLSREVELTEDDPMAWEWPLDPDEQLDFTVSMTEELATIAAVTGLADAISDVVFTLPASLTDNGAVVVDEGINADADKVTLWLAFSGLDAPKRAALLANSPHAVQVTMTTSSTPPRIYQRSVDLIITEPIPA